MKAASDLRLSAFSSVLFYFSLTLPLPSDKEMFTKCNKTKEQNGMLGLGLHTRIKESRSNQTDKQSCAAV